VRSTIGAHCRRPDQARNGEAIGDRRAQSDGVIDEAAGRFRIAKGRAKTEMKKVIDVL
jgi:uncharacterized protein YjbJ (UPF0337 family)